MIQEKVRYKGLIAIDIWYQGIGLKPWLAMQMTFWVFFCTPLFHFFKLDPVVQ